MIAVPPRRFMVLCFVVMFVVPTRVESQEVEPFGNSTIPWVCSSLSQNGELVQIDCAVFLNKPIAFRDAQGNLIIHWMQVRSTKTFNIQKRQVSITDLMAVKNLEFDDVVNSIEKGRPVLLLNSHEMIYPKFRRALGGDTIVLKYTPPYLPLLKE